MKILKQEKGITLVSLIIIIVVIMILAGVSIGYGTETLDNMRLEGFYFQLEIIQKRVDDIVATNEKYVVNNDGDKTIIELNKIGKELTQEQISFLQTVLIENNIKNISASEFKYFTTEDLKNQLDLADITYNVFINFENRIVISEAGIKIKEKMYYMLETKTYFVKQDNSKLPVLNSEEPFSYSIVTYGEKYKIIINPNYDNIDYIPKDITIKYKNVNSKYWETAESLQCVINELGIYEICYEDFNNVLTRTIKVEQQEEKFIVSDVVSSD